MEAYYIVNNEGFVVDPDTGEVIDDFSYRIDYDQHLDKFQKISAYENLAIKRIERTAKEAPRF